MATRTTSGVLSLLLLLAVVVVTSWARDIPLLQQQLLEQQEEREMHPGVTRRQTREVRYPVEEDDSFHIPKSIKSLKNSDKPALSEDQHSNLQIKEHYDDEGGWFMDSLVHMLSCAVNRAIKKAVLREKPAVARTSGKRPKRTEHYFDPGERVGSLNRMTEEDPTFWRDGAQQTLTKHLEQKEIKKKAKNVIMFLGDGMSIPTLAAARILKGQKENKDGEESQLSFEKFPYTGLSKTYCVDTQVADSACSATAYLTGVKNNEGTIGVTSKVKKGDCAAMNVDENRLDSIVKWTQDAGKKTGIVTTTRVTHASPAGTYARTAHRDWESDHNVVEDGYNPTDCQDIASQLINNDPGKNLHVILGGGRSEFRSNAVLDEEGTRGYRMDRQDLIQQWQLNQQLLNRNASYIWNREELLAVNPEETQYLLGLFEGDHTRYNLDRDAVLDPSLAEMTEAAIKVLSANNDEGYFLFIEGGRIDHAHHNTQAQKALDETIQLSLAVEKAVNMTNIQETLIVVTSDHAHTMSIAGYPDRGSNILGVFGMSKEDKMPFSTLSYSNGPGYKKGKDGVRYNMTQDNTLDKEYEFPSMVPLSSETHGGDDVAVFALGPWAHLFVGMYEQNYIPHVMAYASCVGNGAMSCSSAKTSYWRP